MIMEVSVSKGPATSFWAIVRADIARFREEGPGLRPVVRGLLSQGFQALFVYRVLRWCYEHRIPTQPFRFLVERFTEITTGISRPGRDERERRDHHRSAPRVLPGRITCGVFEPDRIAELVEGIAAGCRDAGCALLGGETQSIPT